MTKRCAWCGQAIRDKRSDDISRRFQAHVTWLTQQTHGQYTRDEVLIFALTKAVEIEPPPGGEQYRYTKKERAIYPGGPVMEVADPVSTSSATNRAMMTACRALEYLAMEWDVGPLPERPNTEAIE